MIPARRLSPTGMVCVRGNQGVLQHPKNVRGPIRTTELFRALVFSFPPVRPVFARFNHGTNALQPASPEESRPRVPASIAKGRRAAGLGKQGLPEF